jgi:glutaredoxin
MSYTIECKICKQLYTKFSNTSFADKCPDCIREKKLDNRLGILDNRTVKMKEKIIKLQDSQEMILDAAMIEVKNIISSHFDEQIEVMVESQTDAQYSKLSNNLLTINNRLLELANKIDEITQALE